MFRIRKARETPAITFQVFQAGGNFEAYLTLPRELAENMQADVLTRLQDGIWRSFVLPSTSGTESMVLFRFQSSSCQQSQKPATDGSQGQRQPGSFGQPVVPSIFGGSSPLGFLPDLGLGLF